MFARTRPEDWALNLAHVFRDDGYSGAVLARPGLDRLRDAVKAREVDRVLVTPRPTASRATTCTRWCSWKRGRRPAVPPSSLTVP
jgi:hypothetical protein